MAEIATNILSNAVLPYDPRKLKLVFGSAEYIALEVIVSKIVRKILKADKSFKHLIVLHALSLPFMGGIIGWAPTTGNVQSSTYVKSFTDGALGIPAVLAAQWIMNTFSTGFQFPWFNMKDLLITAGAKTITRPLVKSIVGFLPKDASDAIHVVNAMIVQQQATSVLNRG